MSNITRLMEAKPSRDLQDEKQSSTGRTVDELLKMLSASSSSRKPPPVPPKPSVGNLTLEAAKRSLGIIDHPQTILINSDGGDLADNFGQSLKIDTGKQTTSTTMQHDRDASSMMPNQIFSQSDPAKRSVHKTKSPIGCVVYDSSAKYNYDPRHNDSGPSRMVRPFVTEYNPDEANNNNVMNRMSNASTVEIREVPSMDQSYNIYDEIDHGTYSRVNLQAPKRNLKSNATPVVTTATDDDEEDGDRSDDLKHIELDVDSIMVEASDNHPPRTSTPTSTQCHLNSTSSSGASTATNNNRSSQNTYLSHQPHDSTSDQTDDDTFNVSRETDDLTNTSAHNQSGCELVGINDNSDPNNSKDSPRLAMDQERTPYSVQTFNDTLMSATSANLSSKSQITGQAFNNSTQETKDLKNLVNRLQGEVNDLNSKVASLTKKIDNLTSQLENYKQNDRLFDSTSGHSKVQSGHSPLSAISKNRFSKSTSTINKIAQLKNQTDDFDNLSNTYHRNHVATISRNSNNSPAFVSSGPNTTNTPNYGSGRITMSRSCNTSMAKPLRKSNAHTSMNSLYAESPRSGRTSTSPTNGVPSARYQSTSPNSLMNLSSRRDPMSYSSMLSLSSTSQASTLKRGAAISGSVSNLSQTSSQLSNWPSMSNYVNRKQGSKDVLYDDEERIIRMVLYNTLVSISVPSWAESNYNLDTIVEPPNVKLKLDWVHGYRGRDCRTNIYYLPTGECIYFVASIVVLYNPEEQKQRHYLGHTDSVKCLAIHPNKLIVASGQSAVLNRHDKRPIVRVWDTVSLSTLRVIGFNEDFDASICCLAFSKHDQGATLAVVDESNEHTITLLDWQREKNWRIAETNSGHEPVLAIDFHPIDKYSLVAVGKSTINFWDVRGMTLAKKAGLFDKYDRPKYVLCVTFNDMGETITGDSNGNIIIWPRGSNRPGKIIHDVHPGGVFSVLAMKDGSYLTGGRDRRIIEWDENFETTGRQAELPEHCGGVRFITYARGSQVLVGTLRNAILIGSLDTNFRLIMQGHTEATSALAIHPTESKYLTGGFDEQIHMMNVDSHSIEWSKCLMMPISAASFSNDGQLLVLGSTLGKWLVMEVPSQETLFSACDGSGTISCIKFSPNGELFAMGSSDSQIYIYAVEAGGSRFKLVGTCVGHSAPVREIDWCADSHYIQTQSMNLELLFWRADNCRPVDDPDVVRDLDWVTHNCSLGFNVIGLWPDSNDSVLINHCDRSNSNDLIVSTTDAGFINVHRWPACYNQCLSQKYNGNVDKYSYIKFLRDDSRLIAIGAKSCVTTEWVVTKCETS